MFNSDSVLVPEVVEAGFDPFRDRLRCGWVPGRLFGQGSRGVRIGSSSVVTMVSEPGHRLVRGPAGPHRTVRRLARGDRAGTVDHSPAAHVRRPKVSYESNQVGLDRNELGMFLVQAGIAGGRDHVLACMLAFNGLRIAEALGADIEHSGMVRGHRTLTVTRKGSTIDGAPDICAGSGSV